MANISKHIRTVSFLLQDVRADHKGAEKKNQKHNPNNKTELKKGWKLPEPTVCL